MKKYNKIKHNNDVYNNTIFLIVKSLPFKNSFMEKDDQIVVTTNQDNDIVNVRNITKSKDISDTLYSIIDFKNSSYFTKIDLPKFNIGDKVILNGSYNRFDKSYKHIYESHKGDIFNITGTTYKMVNCYPTVYYYLTTIDDNIKVEVPETNILFVETYWFINTEGKICEAYKGKNKNRDNWLEKVNMKFSNINEARKYFEKIINS